MNVAPAPDLGEARAVAEGSRVRFVRPFADPGTGDTFVYLWHVEADNGQVIADRTGPWIRRRAS